MGDTELTARMRSELVSLGFAPAHGIEAEFGLHHATLQGWVRSKRVRSEYLGRFLWVHRADVREAMAGLGERRAVLQARINGQRDVRAKPNGAQSYAASIANAVRERARDSESPHEVPPPDTSASDVLLQVIRDVVTQSVKDASVPLDKVREIVREGVRECLKEAGF